MNIIKLVKSLDLDKGEYSVFGSALLQMYNLRESHDIDIIVTKNLYNKLKNSKLWKEKIHISGNVSLYKDIFEVFKSWKFGDYSPHTKYLIKNSIYLEEIPFVNIEEVLKWKKIRNSEKDRKDIKLIKSYLNK
ncbi:hypothetical protein M1145_00830 [Patescibacteria group bacterium]|nr:hypothetical protein [Patescibacteria group bacterium]